MEIWKQYRDTNYEVSNTGKVRNKETLKEKTLCKKSYGKHDNDYVKVNLHINGRKCTKSVHRLVAECFLDDYSEKLEVNHKNNIRYDNRVENLEMTTKEENYQYSLTNGNGSPRQEVYCIDKNGNRLDFKSLWEASKFLKETKNFKTSKDSLSNLISKCCRGKSITVGGYFWYYKNNNKYDNKPTEKKKKRGFFTKEQISEIYNAGLNEGIIKRRMIKYNMNYEDSLKLKKGKVLKHNSLKPIDKQSKLYQGLNKRFGRLIVKEIIREKGKGAKYRCLCDCGNEIITYYNNLYNFKTMSCGCLNNEIRHKKLIDKQ